MKIDKAIFDTDRVICNNISECSSGNRGFKSQNILAQLRNLVEYIASKVYAQGKDIDPNDYKLKQESIKYIKTRGELRFLYRFHDLLQKSVSHYTLDENCSERLMLKYFEYLVRIKKYLKDTYNIEVLNNINDFPLNTDAELAVYYKKIAEKINNPSRNCPQSQYNDRYYIQKIKPFVVENEIYYEVTFTAANSKASKFDRVIAFTKHDILSNYSVKLSIHNDKINILGKDMNIQVIDDWSVSIRQCELNNFADILGTHSEITTGSNEYIQLMQFITNTQIPLSELVDSSDLYYNEVKSQVTNNARTTHIFDVLDGCRSLILKGSPGSVTLKYLLFNLNNKIIKSQRTNSSCSMLSNLNLGLGNIPFDQMPFCTSLRDHNPRISDLLECFNTVGREHELFARYIKNNTENKGKLFTPREEIASFENIDNLINIYNSKIYMRKHAGRQLLEYNGCIYIKEYADNSARIIKRLQNLTQTGVAHYTSSVNSWLKNASYIIDSPEKEDALKTMFANSHVALIYGSAGTGKSTLINHLSNYFANQTKIFLANTHPAVDNMRRKINAANCTFNTIASFNSKNNLNKNCDILIIDECSTVSNSDMCDVLSNATFKLLVLVGDVYQIESISFGNWFDIARNFIKEDAIIELTHPYRTKNKNLLTVWERVRELDIAILEPLVKSGYSRRLDESIFNRSEEEEIILCLNYDGLYGINNINRFLQSSNENPEIQWGVNLYKVGDPILFNESKRFSPLIHNNSKGRIVNIRKDPMRIWFDIELDFAMNELEATLYDFDLIGISERDNSIIRFSVDKYKSSDEDDADLDITVPFQIAYAVSIHKAQGLEYNSVKIVITNETEEQITHSIFYTAITRAKESLNIYWSPETENYVLKNLTLHNANKDAILLAQLYSIDD